MKNHLIQITALLIAVAIPVVPALAFDSGSTGADGAFAPTADTQLVMPQSGIFNFTTVDIPVGVDVTFIKNAGNTPVTILASGDVNIAGVVTVNGGNATDVGNAPASSDGTPGVGGPGGSDGGRGGIYIATGDSSGGEGFGLGAGRRGVFNDFWDQPCGGSGGGFGTAGGFNGSCSGFGVGGGGTYGTAALSQLLGGSGGGGGAGGNAFFGSGGGGGGGALLIASSGTVNITGTVRANGGRGGNQSVNVAGGTGGGGSGGAIRIVATTITGEGPINTSGGQGGSVSGCNAGVCVGGAGGLGRIRLEAETLQRVASTNPPYTFSAPQPIFFAELPTLRITSVGGIATPAVPTGDRDVVLPGFTVNPVTVEVATTSVPLGTTVSLTAKPTRGTQNVGTTSGITGSEASGTAWGDINLPNGASVLTAHTTFTVTAALGDALKNFAEGERVERIELAAAPGRGSITTLITVSGKRFTWPSNELVLN